MTAAHSLAMAFGPLEIKVLEAIWLRDTPSSVHDIQATMPGVAYTTIMTTMDRLFRKGVLGREKRGRAFIYSAVASREEQVAKIVASTFEVILPSEGHAAAPILSEFVDALAKRDASLLDELEQLVSERKNRLKAHS